MACLHQQSSNPKLVMRITALCSGPVV